MAGATYQSMRVVDKGVHAAERVITEGLQKVQPGSVVQPKLGDQTDGAKSSAGLAAASQGASK